jgi:DUF971 family protein
MRAADMTLTGSQTNAIWPTEIRLAKVRDSLIIAFDDGRHATLTAELLRVESPSAEVQGHGAGQKTTPVGKRNVRITTITPVGNYAIRIGFDDGHDTGIYSWDLLHDYATRQDQLMAAYCERLADMGADRG